MIRSRPLLLAIALTAACRSSEPALGPEVCSESAAQGTIGCAVITGIVRDGSGRALDGIEGSVRPAASCPCSRPRLTVDENGTFAIRIFQLRPLGVGDTARVTIVAQATHAKYPRHVTGAPYFDTLRVVVPFAAHGSTPRPVDAVLRIFFPGQSAP